MPPISRRMVYLIVAVIVFLPMISLATLSATAKKPQSLGVVNGRLAACPDTPNCVSTQANDADHRIEPIPYDEPPERVMQRLEAAIASVPRTRVIEEKGDYLHAEAISL